MLEPMEFDANAAREEFLSKQYAEEEDILSKDYVDEEWIKNFPIVAAMMNWDDSNLIMLH
jgi:hypothetical protein